ncbi:RHS repeat-associated core domain-containing protein [Pseudodesulfovibrio indicus]|uniref:RHS repeat-associated core domain-containing protein n=1 Tax=Pseudodesulfovibrio indicus TaxID=1716143 RepID=UPI00374937F5
MDGPNHYDVKTGRWTAPDPVGDRGGDPDWCGYCLDDPVNGVDPAGLAAVPIPLSESDPHFAPARFRAKRAIKSFERGVQRGKLSRKFPPLADRCCPHPQGSMTRRRLRLGDSPNSTG